MAKIGTAHVEIKPVLNDDEYTHIEAQLASLVEKFKTELRDAIHAAQTETCSHASAKPGTMTR